MFKCPYCGNFTYRLEEIEVDSRPMYLIFCDTKKKICGKFIGLHEKGIYDCLLEIKEALTKKR